MFIRNPPLPVNPERKVPEELITSNGLAVAEEAALMISPRVLAEAWLRVRRLLTRSVLLIVEDAFTKIPALVEVGVSALVNRVSQAPDEPEAPPQLAPEPVTTPLVSTVRHWVLPVMPLIARDVVVAEVNTVDVAMRLPAKLA